MDTFMDKLAQKFTAQEMIRANAAAEAAELQRTRDQVKKYNECLQEMQKVNENTRLVLRQIEQTLAAGKGQFENAQLPLEEVTELVKSCREQILDLQANVGNVQDGWKGMLDQTGNQITEFVHRENVKVYRNVQAVVVEEMKKQNEELGEKLNRLCATQRTTRNLAVSAMLFSLLSAAALAAQLLLQFGII